MGEVYSDPYTRLICGDALDVLAPASATAPREMRTICHPGRRPP